VIVGNGIDIVEIARIERALARRGGRFRARVFTARERVDCERRRHPGPHFALRFAAKEAGMKAIGTGWRDGVGWHDFEVVEVEAGLEIRIWGRASELAAERRSERAWLGASRTRTHAIAQVLLERSEGA
jgi:holo-[acyl-carrier protein] synthase